MMSDMLKVQINTKTEKTHITDSLSQMVPKADWVELIMSHIPAGDMQKLSQPEIESIASDVWKNFSRKTDAFSLKIFDVHARVDAREYTMISIINNDQPFLVDSIVNAFSYHDITINFLLHPIIVVNRDKEGHLISFFPAGPKCTTGAQESLIIIILKEKLDAQEKQSIATAICDVLQDVHLAVTDWEEGKKTVQAAINSLRYTSPKIVQTVDKEEIISFLQWMESGYFTLLGSREFDAKNNRKSSPRTVNVLGICKRDTTNFYCDDMNEDCARYLPCDEIFKITKTICRSKVHRTAPMDIVRIKKFDEGSNVIGEYEFFGLFTSSVYNFSIRDIPIVRQKLQRVLEATNLSSEWHAGKALINIMETYPREELFQVGQNTLTKFAKKVLEIQDRPTLASLVRRDSLGHMITNIIYVPRERYTADFVRQVDEILSHAFNGRITYFQPLVNTDSYYARLHYTIAVNPSRDIDLHQHSLENTLKNASLRWIDHFKEALIAHYASDKLSGIRRQFLNAFPIQYQERFTVETALKDIKIVLTVLQKNSPSVRLHKISTDDKNLLNLKWYNKNSPIALYDIIPILEHMGLKVLTELHYPVTEGNTQEVVYIHDFALEGYFDQTSNCAALTNVFEESILKIHGQHVENDDFNQLTLSAVMSWEKIILLRAYYKYLKQLEFTYSQKFVAACLSRHAVITQNLVDLFETIFDKKKYGTSKTISQLLEKIENFLEEIKSADEDQVMRQYLNLILSTIRTNYFQALAKGGVPPYVVLKFDCRLVHNMPQPKPMFEMFVYAVDFEAVHLRAGNVARGGLRWSDRQEDFRKEILSLMKAQRVKNTVIVPVGAKGGFVIKKSMNGLSNEVQSQLGVSCYKKMIQAMLDIVDNVQNDVVIKPQNVVCLDQDDPYLVVAADKGTATFSDIANDISSKNNFWLGDAFASGGSVGYDHKKMGITARGAWESVKRHFREMGIDTQTTAFTVVGIGDMSGDVFGNGMLLSQHIKLVGTFNHLHIFLDPDPDVLKSYKERARLFKLPRSAWTDYDTKILSKGGAIFSRSDKYVNVSPEVKKLYKLSHNKITPDALIRAMLHAQVDLLWFGGIGTYIKSTDQTHESAGDRANDNIRMNGNDVQARVIGEGANLGVTQLGRIEYALNGGRINTDAIDNSGGVSCSDHEVNIKILLDQALKKKKITAQSRNKILMDMSGDVAKLVLRDNYLQSQAISIIEQRGAHILERQDRLIKTLEKNGTLDRQVEFLPSDDDMYERQVKHQGLTRPEISVLLAYGKILVYENILHSGLSDDPGLLNVLIDYFPQTLQEKFKSYVENHPLRREIIATYAANSLVNRVGPTFFNEMMELTGATSSQVIQAYLAARNCLDVRTHYWHAIEALDNKVNASVQIQMMMHVVELMDASTLWFLHKSNNPITVSEMRERYANGIQEFSKNMDAFIVGSNKKFVKKKIEKLKKHKVPAILATKISTLPHVVFAWDIIDLSQTTMHSVKDIGCLFFELGQFLSIDWLRHKIDETKTGDVWHKHALNALKTDLHHIQISITKQVLDAEQTGHNVRNRLKSWIVENDAALQGIYKMLIDIKAEGNPDLAMLSVVARRLHTLVQQ